MTNPDYPEGVKERDIDRIGEPFPLTEEDNNNEDIKMKQKITITKYVHGLFSMIACCKPEVNDEEILNYCNRENSSGTMNGWSHVVRNDHEHPQRNPVKCDKIEGNYHFIVDC